MLISVYRDGRTNVQRINTFVLKNNMVSGTTNFTIFFASLKVKTSKVVRLLVCSEHYSLMGALLWLISVCTPFTCSSGLVRRVQPVLTSAQVQQASPSRCPRQSACHSPGGRSGRPALRGARDGSRCQEGRLSLPRLQAPRPAHECWHCCTN